jgi:hypothetical protein
MTSWNIISYIAIISLIISLFAIYSWSYNAKKCQVIEQTQPESEVVKFLEGQLSRCFDDENLCGKKLTSCKDTLSNFPKVVCEDRNKWFLRAHQAYGIQVPYEELWECEN